MHEGMVLALISMAALTVPLLAMGGAGEDGNSKPDDVTQQFVGNYRLVGFERFGADGAGRRIDMIGRIMYDAHGNMAAQLQPAGFRERAEDAQVSRQRGGYVAYFGRYVVDAEAGTVTHHVIGSNRPEWAGDEEQFGEANVRHYEFVDGMLRLSLKDSEGRVLGTLSWRRCDESGND